MTENYPPAAMPPSSGASQPPTTVAQEQGTADVVKDQASDLGQSSVQTGKHVAGVAREQASEVAAEAGRQGRDLLQQAQGQLEEQAALGQQRLADRLLSLSDELRSMADGSQGGMAADLAHQVASRARDAGQWLGDRRPGQVMDEVQSFARRKPTLFLALAAGAGLVAGRLTRGLKDASNDDSASAGSPAARPELSGQWAQPSEVAAYPPVTGGVIDEPVGLPADGLPPADADQAWEASPAYSEQNPLVENDQAGRQGIL